MEKHFFLKMYTKYLAIVIFFRSPTVFFFSTGTLPSWTAQWSPSLHHFMGQTPERVQLKKQFSPLVPFPFLRVPSVSGGWWGMLLHKHTRLVLPVLSQPGADLQVTAGDIFPMNLAIWSKTSPPFVFYVSRLPQHRWSVGKGELWPSGPDPSPALAQREHRPLWRRPREDHHLRLRGRGLLRQPPHPLTPLRG